MRSANRRNRITTALFALLTLAACGCTSTHVTRVARFETARAADAVYTAAPASAAYKVKYADARGKGLKSVGGSKRIVRRGDPLGFATSPDGALVAVAGNERFPLDKLPPDARYCVWTAKEKRPTQFSREVGKATTTVATAALIGAIGMGAAYTELLAADDRDDRCEDEGGNRRKRTRRRGYRWVGADAAPGPVAPKAEGTKP